MSSSSLIRLGGLATVVGGVLFLIGDLLSLVTESENLSESATTAPHAITWLLLLLGAVLVLIGLPGLHVRQSETAGILGLAGFVAAFLGTALVLGAIWAQLFVAPFVAAQAPSVLDSEPTGALALGFTMTFALLTAGWLLFGIAALRARVYPRAAAIVLMVGAVLNFLPVPLSGIVLDVAIAWLGFVLFTGRGKAAHQPSSVR